MNLTIWTKGFVIATAERVIATFAGALLAVFIADGFDPMHADWKKILITAALAAGVSLLKAVVANGVTKNGPGLTDSEQVVPPEPQPVADADEAPEYIPERALNDE